ncbi:MAG: hypothetical protein V3T58_04105 [Candidatus Hydrothermarchaeales archaeon]
MGSDILQLTEEEWGELKDRAVEQDGWFVPSLHIKYLEDSDRKTERLKRLCAAWLKDKFGYEAIIERLEVLEPEDIDRLLDLVRIRFEFSVDNGMIGDSVAFFSLKEVEVPS